MPLQDNLSLDSVLPRRYGQFGFPPTDKLAADTDLFAKLGLAQAHERPNRGPEAGITKQFIQKPVIHWHSGGIRWKAANNGEKKGRLLTSSHYRYGG